MIHTSDPSTPFTARVEIVPRGHAIAAVSFRNERFRSFCSNTHRQIGEDNGIY